MRLRLVVPVDVEAATGGNVYDLALAEALRRDGHVTDVVRCGPDDLADLLGRPTPGPTLVDGLLVGPAPQVVARAGVGVLVHMPLAWEADLSTDEMRARDEQERQALRAATVVVATSHWAAAYLRRRHALPFVAVAAPGVDPAAVVTGSEPPLLVHVAAFLPNKDQLSVVSAVARLVDLPWRLRLAGSVDRHPAYAEQVHDAVATRDLRDRVEIAGVLDRNAAWAGADLALLPSRAEAFGMVVTEALARGVPAVVSEGGAAEALGLTPEGRRPGMVVPAGDVDALTTALRGWLSEPDTRDELRERALARRLTLDGWGMTARRVVDALARR